MFLIKLFELYSYIVIGAVIVSWINLPRNNPLVKTLDALTEPLLKPIRSILPASSGLDFSPIVLLVALQMLIKFLR